MLKTGIAGYSGLFTAKKRYGLVILNYVVTSNHIHLLVYDDKAQDVIPKSMQLIAGRVWSRIQPAKKPQRSFLGKTVIMQTIVPRG